MHHPRNHTFARLSRFVICMAGVFMATSSISFMTGLQRAPDDRVPTGVSPITVDPDDLDFGMAFAQPHFQWSFPVTNQSTQTITINAIKSSCACTSLVPRSLSIAPGESRDVHVTLDLTPTDDAIMDATQIRPFSASLMPIIAGHRVPHSMWELHGRVSAGLTMTPTALFYGEALVHGVPHPAKSVLLDSREALAEVDISCDTKMATTSVMPADRAKRRFELPVTPNPELPLGRFAFAPVVTATTRDGSQLPPMYLVVHGTVYRDIEPFPRVLWLGQQYLMRSVGASVLVRSARGERVSITDVHHEDDVANVELSDAPLTDQQRVAFTLVPRQLGHQESRIKCTVLRGGAVLERVSIPIRYYVLDQMEADRAPEKGM